MTQHAIKFTTGEYYPYIQIAHLEDKFNMKNDKHNMCLIAGEHSYN